MNWNELIGTHGYWLLAMGCLLEGETLLLLAGYAAHRGNLSLTTVIMVASVAGFAGDQFWFWLGRRHGPKLIARWPALGQQRDRVYALLHRFHAAVVIGVRFAYGLRIAGPVLIGTTTITALRFALLNAIGALLWALLIAGLGWAFGSAAEALLGQLQHFEALFLTGAALLAALTWWIRRRKQRKG